MNKAEFRDWLKDPRTQEVMSVLEEYRKAWELSLLSGKTLRGVNPSELTAETVGVLRGIDYVLQIEWDDDEDKSPSA